jgi:hypothetical protein
MRIHGTSICSCIRMMLWDIILAIRLQRNDFTCLICTTFMRVWGWGLEEARERSSAIWNKLPWHASHRCIVSPHVPDYEHVNKKFVALEPHTEFSKLVEVRS